MLAGLKRGLARLGVGQHSLRRCRLDLDDHTLERATLFPLFDEQGRTRALLITTEESGRILSIAWRPDLLNRRGLWRYRLSCQVGDLRDIAAPEVMRLRDLWHFDPWWVLGESRYLGHRAVPMLRATNIPGYDETITRIGFDAALGRVLYLATGTADSLAVTRDTTKGLAAAVRKRRETAPPAVPARRSPAEWRLRPFWMPR